jgi:phosphoglycerate kinase
MQPFDRGTVALAKVIAASRAQSIAGGGETVDAIRRAGVAKRFTFLSTGGGAMLEFLEGKTLPGVTAVTVQR